MILLNSLRSLPVIAIACIAFLVSFPSCYAGKKIKAKELIASVKETISGEDKQAAGIKSLASDKLNEENIDTSINNRISEKLEAYKKNTDSIKTGVSSLEELVSSSKLFRKGYKKKVIPIMALLKKYNETASVRVFKYTMIKDGLTIAEKKLFPLAAFFGPGKYEVPEDKKADAFTLFGPVADSLIVFSNKYSDINQTGYLIVNGFADGTGFNPNSPLYQKLLEGLKKTSAEKAELNSQLSQWRAASIADLLEALVKNKSSLFKSWTSFAINMYSYGQGETFPTKTIKDYTDDDERRRVVILYWCILPAN